MLKRTPLFAAHQQLGARLVEFGGWEMPVRYSSIMDEHQAVRRAAGLFDISHMGEVRVTGPSALGFLNRTLTNDLHKLAPGHGQYTLMCNERGGVIDDLYAYRLGNEDFLLVINASRIEPDIAWLRQKFHDAKPSAADHFENLSEALAAIALQGPRAVEFIDSCFAPNASDGGTSAVRPSQLKKNQVATFLFAGEPVQVARTGYTGEDGFEIYVAPEQAERVWNEVMNAGQEFGIKPCGLGARNTLRLEAKMALYGHEIDASVTPLEANLGWIVKFDKGDFLGRAALLARKEAGLRRKLVGFEMTGRGIGRDGYEVLLDGAPAGWVTSGGPSPTLGRNIGLCYLPAEHAVPGTAIQILIRNQPVDAITVPTPFYKRAK